MRTTTRAQGRERSLLHLPSRRRRRLLKNLGPTILKAPRKNPDREGEMAMINKFRMASALIGLAFCFRLRRGRRPSSTARWYLSGPCCRRNGTCRDVVCPGSGGDLLCTRARSRGDRVRTAPIPVVTNYAPTPVVTNYAPAPVVTTPVVTSYAPAPLVSTSSIVTAYAPAPIVSYAAPVVTYRPIASTPLPVVTYSPVTTAVATPDADGRELYAERGRAAQSVRAGATHSKSPACHYAVAATAAQEPEHCRHKSARLLGLAFVFLGQPAGELEQQGQQADARQNRLGLLQGIVTRQPQPIVSRAGRRHCVEERRRAVHSRAQDKNRQKSPWGRGCRETGDLRGRFRRGRIGGKRGRRWGEAECGGGPRAAVARVPAASPQ